MRVTSLDGSSVLSTWTLTDPTDTIGTSGTVGGHRYGSFAIQEFTNLAIDDVNLLSVNLANGVSACKNDGWLRMTRQDGSPFINQGDCIQYVNSGK